MKIKYLYLILIFLIFMVSISAASAAEDASSDISCINEEIVLESIDEEVPNEEISLNAIDDYVLEENTDEEIISKSNVGNILDRPSETPNLSAAETGTFTELNATINGNAESVINLEHNYAYNKNYDSAFKDGVVISRPLTINGNGITIDGKNMARIFNVTDSYVVFNDINFINGNAHYGDGGAIYGECAINNCNFTQNNASVGGAIYDANAINCTFTNNTATYGGAMYGGRATNCTFTQNTADKYGGAMYESGATNCIFTKNMAGYDGGATFWTNAINCTFTQNTAKVNGGAMRGDGNAINCTFTLNFATKADKDIMNINATDCTFITPNLSASDLDTIYDSGKKLMFNLKTAEQTFNDVKAIISIYKKDTFVANYSALTGDGWIVNLSAGTYKAVLSIANSNVTPVNAKITIAKKATKINAKTVTTTYNVNKYLTITLKDSEGKALSGVKITVKIAGAKKYKTNNKGQVKINIKSLVPKTYTAKIGFVGNKNYIASLKSVKVVVKKAKPKIIAKKKTFKRKVKTKKYTITLKTNKNKALKKVKVTLRVKGKTYKAKTNSKGKATFKIKNLKKKRTYKATIKFAGNKYYKKVSKKVKIKVKK